MSAPECAGVPDWRHHAACRGEDPELFCPPVNTRTVAAQTQIAVAKTVCGGCPVRHDCLEWVLGTPDGHTIAGGLTPEERRELRRERGLHRTPPPPRGVLPPVPLSPGGDPMDMRRAAVQARQAAVHALAQRGLSIPEIASWVGLSPDHVRRRVRRAATDEQST